MTDTKLGRPLACATCSKQPAWTPGDIGSLATIECHNCCLIVGGLSRELAQERWNHIQRALIALAAIPDPRKVLRERLLRLIKTRGEVSEGVLLNLVRPIKWQAVSVEILALLEARNISAWERKNPRNKKLHVIYRHEQE